MNKLLAYLYLKLVAVEREDFISAFNWLGTGFITCIVSATLVLIIYNLFK